MIKRLWFAAGLAALVAAASPALAQPILGDAPRAPKDTSGLPGGGPGALTVTGGFSVDTSSREEVRAFFNAVYASSDGVPMASSANVSTCTSGTNSSVFQEAVLRRINWFRAMAGVPAAVTLDPGDCANDQQAAVIMSANTNLSHFPPPTWSCYTGPGANAASNSNLALGSSGADAITGYIWDYGAANYELGHRRWILYPQTQIMGTGDVPSQGGFYAANATWVFDAHVFGPRPATRQPCVAWPPSGYVPYQVVFPQWSLALSNADFSVATVSMTSNGVSVAVSRQPYITGYGENTLAWVPMGLDYTSYNTRFPFNGADTVYSITVTNIKVGAAMIGFSYTVTVFDPAAPGPDYVAPAISGPAQPTVNAANNYACAPVNNSHVTGYQWRISQRAPGNVSDGAEGGLVNFTAALSPGYSVITNTPTASGSRSFYLAHPTAAAQTLQLKEWLFPATNTVVNFKSLLAYATSSEVARVQASVDGGGTWRDIYAQPGTGGAGESTFQLRTASLSACAGRATLLRFNYDYVPYGSYYYQVQPGFVGWSLDDIVITNTEQVVNMITNVTATNTFVFTPLQAGNYNLEAQAVIFGEFPIGWGPVAQVSAVTNAPPVLTLSRPVVSGSQLWLDFTVLSGSSASFTLLQVDQLGTAWTTNTTATLTTNVPGSSYRFTTAVSTDRRFYRVRAP